MYCSDNANSSLVNNGAGEMLISGQFPPQYETELSGLEWVSLVAPQDFTGVCKPITWLSHDESCDHKCVSPGAPGLDPVTPSLHRAWPRPLRHDVSTEGTRV